MFLDTLSSFGSSTVSSDFGHQEQYRSEEITAKTERIFGGITTDLKKANEQLDAINAKKDTEVSTIFFGLKERNIGK